VLPLRSCCRKFFSLTLISWAQSIRAWTEPSLRNLP
jgi:hypothetical protein